MLASTLKILSLNELRRYVHETLCEHEQFQPGAFPMTERLLTRGGRKCGMYFCLHGPRSVKCTSIWETEKNSILFYGNDGERFHRTYLSSTPQLVDSDRPSLA